MAGRMTRRLLSDGWRARMRECARTATARDVCTRHIVVGALARRPQLRVRLECRRARTYMGWLPELWWAQADGHLTLAETSAFDALLALARALDARQE